MGTRLSACRDAPLLEALIAVGVPVASGPPDVSRALLQHTLAMPALLTPARLRAHVRAAPDAARAACTAQPAHAAALLAYCLQDVDEGDARSCAELLGKHCFCPLVISTGRLALVAQLLSSCLGKSHHLP